ncbi:hypothetical protein [Nonomuraea sp. KM88]|uniref:hypothetical protein n=1 Tax=Nonomuraea sp. KM88 TaxID=3457427 RepID=UPI003FCD5BFB
MELLAGGSEGGFDGSHFAEPALFFGLGEAVDEVGVDLLQPGLLSWVDAKEGASDATSPSTPHRTWSDGRIHRCRLTTTAMGLAKRNN